MLTLPVVFVCHTLYNKALESNTQKIIDKKVSVEINNIFARYLFFTQFFLNSIEDSLPGDVDHINNLLKTDEATLFTKISNNIFSGIFLFSKFDPYDEYIFNTINESVILKYMDSKEIALLFNFIDSFNSLKENFMIISKEEFIYFDKYKNIDIQKSNYTQSSENNLFYDSMWIRQDGTTESFYSAMYPLFEKEILIQKYKLSGNIAKSLAKNIYESYVCINDWLNHKNLNSIQFTDSTVICGRLFLNSDITLNLHMKENFTFTSHF